MMKMRLALLAGLLMFAIAPAPVQAQALEVAQPTLDQSELTILSGEQQHIFTVELANDQIEISTGLMFRTEMAPDAGMLFDLGAPRRAAFYMKNTLIPLDMLFIDSDGEILAIASDAVPRSLRNIDPGVEVKAVLELNAGMAKELAIQPGDMIVHPIFQPAGQG